MDKKRSLRKVGSIYLSDKNVSTKRLQGQKSEINTADLEGIIEEPKFGVPFPLTKKDEKAEKERA